MTSYEDLPSVITDMKIAAIDSFMAEQNWFTHFEHTDEYALWGIIATAAYRRPDANGDGGGEPIDGAWTVWGESMAPSFDSIRGWIHDLTSPWLSLPDGDACDTPCQATEAAANVFGLSSGPTAAANGDIARRNQTISDALMLIDGAFTVPFQNKYILQFATVIDGISGSATVLQSNYAAQAAMWPAVRDDVTTLLVKTRDALRAHADGLGEELGAAVGSITLTVVMIVAGAVATVLTAGTAAVAVGVLLTVAGGAQLALEAIDGQAEIEGDDYVGLLTSLGDALSRLNSRIREQEDILAGMLNEASGYFLSDPGAYNLDAFVMPDYPGVTGTVTIDQTQAYRVSFNMEETISTLTEASGKLASAPDSNPTPRDGSIGRGANGTHYSAVQLYNLAESSLLSTIAEYGRGRDLFDATVRDFFDTDADASATVNSLAAAEVLVEEMGG